MITSSRVGRLLVSLLPLLTLLLVNSAQAFVAGRGFERQYAFVPASRSSSRTTSSKLQYMPTNTGDSQNNDKNGNSNSKSNNPRGNRNLPPPKPFIIERIGDASSEGVYRQIADMCIDVFFKEQLDARPEDRVPPWKEAQISYLKTLQAGDLRRRRDRYPRSNEMFLAYAVESALNERFYGSNYRKTPLVIQENGEIYNLPQYMADQPFVRGELLGFVEITQRPYGLGVKPSNKNNVDEYENECFEDSYQYDQYGQSTPTQNGRNGPPPSGKEELRPILTNLAVSRNARTLGIGSKLLDRCERHAARNWNMNEIVLEVEDYNTQALDFYTRRGYDVLYSDPASRRFDVGGLYLRKVRCTRRILRKLLTIQRAQQAGENLGGRSFDFFSNFVNRVGNR